MINKRPIHSIFLIKIKGQREPLPPKACTIPQKYGHAPPQSKFWRRHCHLVQDYLPACTLRSSDKLLLYLYRRWCYRRKSWALALELLTIAYRSSQHFEEYILFVRAVWHCLCERERSATAFDICRYTNMFCFDSLIDCFTELYSVVFS